MIAELEAAITHEVADKAIPSISYTLFDRKQVLGEGHIVRPGSASLADDALFRIGSITKTFTALAAMQEVEAGRLDLDADVSRYLGDFHPTWQGERAPVTLRRLLSHRSGLTREAAHGHYLADDAAPLCDTVDSLRNSRLKVAPDGQTYRYSNAGFALVGACLEAASGQSYRDYLQQRILAPLGLTDTFASFDLTQRKRLAPAQMWTLERDGKAPVFNMGCAPAGNIVASMTDLARFGQAMMKGEFVSPATVATMSSLVGNAPHGYGFGLMVGEIAGQRLIGHGGVVYGYASQLTLLPEAGLGVAMVGTLDAVNHIIIRLCRYALRLALASRLGTPKPTAPRRIAARSASTAAQLAGRYVAADGHEIELRATARGLLLVDRLMPLELRPVTAQSFLVEGRLHGEDSGYPAPALDWDGADELTWAGRIWRREQASAPLAPSDLYGPDFLPTRLLRSGGGDLICVMEEYFPHACTPLSETRYVMGPGMYQDEILELNAAGPDRRRGIRVGEMFLASAR